MAEETTHVTHTTHQKKENAWKWATFALVIVLVAVVFYMIGNRANPGDGGGGTTPPDTQPSSATIDDDAMEGSKTAKVTIIEFSDYQCPFCRKFWVETYPQIKKDYIDTGKVRLVFRDFPLSSLHPMAEKSAEASECVREKGGDTAYWKFHDKMFSEENILDSGTAGGAVTKTVTYTETDLKKWAKDLGYDIGTCLDTGKYADEVAKDERDGSAAGVQGTPAFIINGQLVSGAQPYSAFKQVIDAALA